MNHAGAGTNAGHQWHIDYKIPVCPPCRQAHAIDMAVRRDMRKLIAVLAELFDAPAAVCISCSRSLRTCRNCPHCGQRDARKYLREAA